MGVGTVAARVFLDLPWALASLYGALMIVTGPTVVTPMLSRIPLDRRVRELLVGEGVLIDPLGAIIAIVVAEYIVGQAAAWEAAGRVVIRLGVGAAIGVASSGALARALRHGWIADELRNPVVLGTALITAALASSVSSEAGLMAAVVQGVVLGNIGLRSIARLRQFKEELTVLLLSFLFVVLAADLRLSAVAQLGWASLRKTSGSLSSLNVTRPSPGEITVPVPIVSLRVSGGFVVWSSGERPGLGVELAGTGPDR